MLISPFFRNSKQDASEDNVRDFIDRLLFELLIVIYKQGWKNQIVDKKSLK